MMPLVIKGKQLPYNCAVLRTWFEGEDQREDIHIYIYLYITYICTNVYIYELAGLFSGEDLLSIAPEKIKFCILMKK